MAHYEIEIKSLLGSKESADKVKAKMLEIDPSCLLVSTNSQLNHYFEGGDIAALYAATKQYFSAEVQTKFEKIVAKGKDFSIRSRKRDAEILLVVKASLDESTSANGVLRLEFEEPVPVSLDELDQILLGAGYTYQAKWSREREEYAYKGINVCFDKNAGYGYLAEFEKVIHDETEVASTRSMLDAIMNELEVTELDQARLGRMFTHYNEHWNEYYGTEKTFIIE